MAHAVKLGEEAISKYLDSSEGESSPAVCSLPASSASDADYEDYELALVHFTKKGKSVYIQNPARHIDKKDLVIGRETLYTGKGGERHEVKIISLGRPGETASMTEHAMKYCELPTLIETSTSEDDDEPPKPPPKKAKRQYKGKKLNLDNDPNKLDQLEPIQSCLVFANQPAKFTNATEAPAQHEAEMNDFISTTIEHKSDNESDVDAVVYNKPYSPLEQQLQAADDHCPKMQITFDTASDNLSSPTKKAKCKECVCAQCGFKMGCKAPEIPAQNAEIGTEKPPIKQFVDLKYTSKEGKEIFLATVYCGTLLELWGKVLEAHQHNIKAKLTKAAENTPSLNLEAGPAQQDLTTPIKNKKTRKRIPLMAGCNVILRELFTDEIVATHKFADRRGKKIPLSQDQQRLAEAAIKLVRNAMEGKNSVVKDLYKDKQLTYARIFNNISINVETQIAKRKKENPEPDSPEASPCKTPNNRQQRSSSYVSPRKTPSRCPTENAEEVLKLFE